MKNIDVVLSDPDLSAKFCASFTKFGEVAQMIQENESNPRRQLEEINRNTQDTAENTAILNDKVETLETTVSELHETVVQLRTELDDERKRAAKAVEAEKERANKAEKANRCFTIKMNIATLIAGFLLNILLNCLLNLWGL